MFGLLSKTVTLSGMEVIMVYWFGVFSGLLAVEILARITNGVLHGVKRLY